VGYHAHSLVDEPCIVIGRKGAAGTVHLSRIPCWPIDTTYFTRPSSVVTLEFLYYSLRSLNLQSLDRSTAIPGLNRDDLYAQRIPLPPLPEQHRIVAEIEKQFTRLDAGVAALKRVQANLKRYRASVLKAACEGRLAPQDPADELAGRLLARILAERRAKWEAEHPGKRYVEPAAPVTDGLPELPAGWCWASWKQIGFSQNGRSFPSQQYQAFGVRLLRPGNLDVHGKVIWTEANTRHMSEKWARDFPHYLVGGSELVINLTAQSLKDEFLGRVCMTDASERCLLNQRIARLSPVIVLPTYVFWLFKSPIFRRFVDSLNAGSLIQHMFTSQLDGFLLPLPPLPEQHRIVAEIERRLSVVAALEATIAANLARAGRLRQAVLKCAFEGRLVAQDMSDTTAATTAREDGAPWTVGATGRSPLPR